jgi:hypothetical protein
LACSTAAVASVSADLRVELSFVHGFGQQLFQPLDATVEFREHRFGDQLHRIGDQFFESLFAVLGVDPVIDQFLANIPECCGDAQQFLPGLAALLESLLRPKQS